jgi:predicted nucleic acid-binding Zn ribbon protein
MSLSGIDGILKIVQERPEFSPLQDRSRLRRAWEEIVSPQLASHTRPKSLDRGILTIATTNASLAHQLSFQRQQLVKQLIDRLPEAGIKDLRFAPLGITEHNQLTTTEVDRDCTVSTCPDCETATPQWELNRWDVCRFCAIDRGILGS